MLEHLAPKVGPPRPGRVVLDLCGLVGAWRLGRRVRGREDDRTQRHAAVGVELLVVDSDAEEPGEPERLVGARGLDMAPKRLGPHVDTKRQLRQRAGIGRWHGARVGSQRADRLFAIPLFVGLEEHRSVFVFGECVEPLQECARLAWRQRSQRVWRKLEKLSQAEQSPNIGADRIRVGVGLGRAVGGAVGVRQRVVLFDALSPVALQGRDGSCDAPRAAAEHVGQLGLVKQAHGEVLRRVDRLLDLGRVLRVLATPAHKPRPPRKLRQLPCEVLHAAVGGDFQPTQRIGDGVLGGLGKVADLVGEPLDTEESARQVSLCQLPPR